MAPEHPEHDMLTSKWYLWVDIFNEVYGISDITSIYNQRWFGTYTPVMAKVAQLHD